jgi:hypothetical protein
MKSASVALTAMAFATLGACDRIYSNLVIRNDGSSRISDILLEYGKTRSKIADLEPGSKVEFNRHVTGEGGMVIHYTSKGRRFSYEACYYTLGMPPRGEVTIRDGTATRVCR